MNWIEFFASVIKSLAWPATVLILVILLRKPLSRLLLRLRHAKYKDLDLDFERELTRAKAEAEALDITPQKPKSIAATTPDSSRLLDEATALAHDFPEPAVALGWQAVEAELMAAVMRLAISPDSPSFNSARMNTELLKRQNAIDQRTVDLLNRMAGLRNMAVHGGYGASVTRDEAIEFLALAKGVVEKLRSLRRS